jgi:uncharacterized protein (TIRG00374 family)
MRRRTTLILIQVLLGAILLGLWLWIIDLAEVTETLRGIQWIYALLAGGLGIASSYLRAVRWRLVLRPIISISRSRIWLISLASSLINFVIPIRSGELARALFLKQRHRVPISVSLPTVAVDRSLDLFAVVVVGAIGAISGIAIEGSVSVVLIVGALLFVVFAGLVGAAILAQDRLLEIVPRLVPAALGARWQARIIELLSGVLAGFASIGRHPKSLLPLAGLSFAATLLDAAVFFVLFLSVGNAVSPVVALMGYALFVITFLVPGAPGYIGSMEAFGSLVFGALGVGGVEAASTIVLFHALNAVMLGLLGGLAIWTLGLRPASAFRSVLRTEPSDDP